MMVAAHGRTYSSLDSDLHRFVQDKGERIFVSRLVGKRLWRRVRNPSVAITSPYYIVTCPPATRQNPVPIVSTRRPLRATLAMLGRQDKPAWSRSTGAPGSCRINQRLNRCIIALEGCRGDLTRIAAPLRFCASVTRLDLSQRGRGML
jgi:hypothetical protein